MREHEVTEMTPFTVQAAEDYNINASLGEITLLVLIIKLVHSKPSNPINRMK